MVQIESDRPNCGRICTYTNISSSYVVHSWKVYMKSYIRHKTRKAQKRTQIFRLLLSSVVNQLQTYVVLHEPITVLITDVKES